jgi:hypothetical protein
MTLKNLFNKSGDQLTKEGLRYSPRKEEQKKSEFEK